VEPFCKKNIKPIKDNDVNESCSRYSLVLSFPISFLFKFTCITNSNQFEFILETRLRSLEKLSNDIQT